MYRKAIFKAYFLTHELLVKFQESGGYHSLCAEEELFNACLDFLTKKNKELYLLDTMDFNFGLKKRDLKNALKRYEKYIKEHTN